MTQIETHEAHRPQPAPTPVAYLGGRLVVDTDAAVRHLFAALGCETATGTAFTRAWHSRAWLYAHTRDDVPTTGDFSGHLPPKGVGQARRDTPVGFVTDLNAAGVKADLKTIHFDGVEDAYVDADRAVQVLRLHEALGLTEVAWPGCTNVDFGLAQPEPEDAKVLTTWILKPGRYLLVWRFPWNRPVLHGAARIDHEPDGDAIAWRPGFQAQYLDATCERCGLAWTAQGGSTRFELRIDSMLSGPWRYTDATGHAGSTIDCPSTRCAGRVRLHN